MSQMNPRVLVVDDETAFAGAIARRLSRRGYRVEVAASGHEALEALARECCDAVVLDVRMPGMDGLATLEAIRASYPQTAVIMLSGHADTTTARKGLEHGADDYLLKPLQDDELFHRLEDAMTRRALCGQSGA